MYYVKKFFALFWYFVGTWMFYGLGAGALAWGLIQLTFSDTKSFIIFSVVGIVVIFAGILSSSVMEHIPKNKQSNDPYDYDVQYGNQYSNKYPTQNQPQNTRASHRK